MMERPKTRSNAALIAAAIALVACLWIGWSDFDPYVPQAAVREAIRATPRTVVQLLVQFVAPALLVAFLVRAAIARRNAPRG